LSRKRFSSKSSQKRINTGSNHNSESIDSWNDFSESKPIVIINNNKCDLKPEDLEKVLKKIKDKKMKKQKQLKMRQRSKVSGTM